MTTTDSNGIIRYQTSDPVSPLQTLLNLGMQSVSDAITGILRKSTVNPVANTSERTALVTTVTAAGRPPSATNPLVVFRYDSLTLEINVGTGWRDYSGYIKTRQLAATAGGPLNGAVDMVAAQTTPAAPFGVSPYELVVTAQASVSIPAGLGVVLELLYDGVSYSEDRFTNAGTTSMTYTPKATLSVIVSDQSTHTLRARITSLAGTVTIYPVGYVRITAQPRSAL